MQIDSKPEELDEFDRRIVQLRIEQEALKKRPTPPRRTGLRGWSMSLRGWRRNPPP